MAFEKKHGTNKTIFKSIDDTCSSDLLDMNDYKAANKIGYRYILVVTDNFSKLSWTTPLKSNYAQTTTDAFSHVIKTSKHISSKQMMEKSTSIKFSTNC